MAMELSRSTLFISNLPYAATSTDLQTLFSDIAPVRSAFVVLEHGTGISKGVGYVSFAIKEDAHNALEEIEKNGIKLNGRKLRAEWAGSKPRKTHPSSSTPKFKSKGPNHASGPIIRAIAGESIEGKRKRKKVEQEGDSSSGSEDEDSEALGDHEHQSDSNEEVETEEPVKSSLPPPETGTTLFIRNLPFSATEDELRTLFRSFGPLRYARITLDHESGRSRGTGFACFWNKSDADKVVEQSELLKIEMTGINTQPKKNPFTLPSILTPDPSSTLAHNLVLHGRTLDVTRAVTRDDARKLKEEGERKREKADKRNLYLLREGVIMPNTAAAASLTPAEVELRTKSFNARRTLLRSNPSLFISKTRLSIRQIPLFVTERVLKRLAIHAVRAFDDEVKKGERTALTRDELLEVGEEQDLLLPMKVKGEADIVRLGKKSQKSGRGTSVKQAKIVRQHERVDPVTGKGRSKGYGFVEMFKHADALRVLRWTNNNPDIGPLCDQWWQDELKDLIKHEKAKPEHERDQARLKRMTNDFEKAGPLGKNTKRTLIAEFSIENVQVVQRRSAQQKERVASAKELKRPIEKIVLKKSKMEEPPAKKRRTSAGGTYQRC